MQLLLYDEEGSCQNDIIGEVSDGVEGLEITIKFGLYVSFLPVSAIVSVPGCVTWTICKLSLLPRLLSLKLPQAQDLGKA